MTDFNLETFLPYQLNVLSTRISAGFAEYYQRAYGISIPEWRVVAHLSKSGPLSVRDIHLRANLEKSRVSRAVDRLQEAGYLRKTPDPTDRRLLALHLTDKGAQMMAELAPMAAAYEAQVMAQLGEEAAPFLRAITRLNAALSDDTSPMTAPVKEPKIPTT